MLAAKLIFRNGLWVGRKVETEIAMRCSAFRLDGLARKQRGYSEGLSVTDQTYREFANRCGFSTHPTLLLLGSGKLFDGNRCQSGGLRAAETDARKRGPAGRYLLTKFDTLPRRHS
jgi:hypothetical protein